MIQAQITLPHIKNIPGFETNYLSFKTGQSYLFKVCDTALKQFEILLAVDIDGYTVASTL